MGKNKKKKKKLRDGAERKEKVKKPWAERITIRLNKAQNMLSKAAKMIDNAHPPDVDVAKLPTVITSVESVLAQIAAIPVEWVPPKAKSKKIGIGSIIIVKPDLDADDLQWCEAFGGTKIFDYAVVRVDDGRQWIVKCQDGMGRIIKKRHVMKAPEDKGEKTKPKKDDKPEKMVE